MQLQICAHGRASRLCFKLFSRCASVRKARVGLPPHTDYTWNERLRLLFFFSCSFVPTHCYQRARSYSSCVTCIRYNRCTFQKVTPLIGDALNICSRETDRQKAQCLNCHLPLRDCMAYQAWSNACSYENSLLRMWNGYVYRDDAGHIINTFYVKLSQ